MTSPPGPTRSSADAVAAIRGRQAEIDQICGFAFGTPEAGEVTRQTLEVAAKYRMGSEGQLRGKARARTFTSAAGATQRLLTTLQGLGGAELGDLMMPVHARPPSGSLDPEQLAAERFGQPLRLTALADGLLLVSLLERCSGGLARDLAEAASQPVGRPPRADPATFLAESLHAIWLRFADGRSATEGTNREDFAGFVDACQDIVTQAAGAPFAQSTVHDAVVALLRNIRAVRTPPA